MEPARVKQGARCVLGMPLLGAARFLQVCHNQHCLVESLHWQAAIRACTPKCDPSCACIRRLRKLGSWVMNKSRAQTRGCFLTHPESGVCRHYENSNHSNQSRLPHSWLLNTSIWPCLLTHFPVHPVLDYWLHCSPGQAESSNHFHVLKGSFCRAISKAWPKPSGFFVTLQGDKDLETHFLKWLLKKPHFAWNWGGFNLIQ